MVPHYAPKHFLRLAPKAQRAAYFRSKHLLEDLDIDQLDESDVDPIYEAMQKLPGNIRSLVDSDFQAVEDLASSSGMGALADAAKARDLNLTDLVRDQASLREKSFSMLLNHLEVFNIALRFWGVDQLSNRYWVRRAGLPRPTNEGTKRERGGDQRADGPPPSSLPAKGRARLQLSYR